jgi:CheY-like chemotaxis protein
MTDSARSGPAPGGPRPSVTAISDVRPQDFVEVSGIIRSAIAVTIGGSPACRYTLSDRTSELDLLFLGRLAVAGLERGRHCRVAGRAAVRDGRITIWNPRYWLQPGRVLIVDDDKAIRRVLELSLTARGYEVDLAATGAAAIDLARCGPDLIILDIGLPDLSGLAAITAIRASCDATIIVISAQEAVAARTAALAAGAADYLPKPFAIDMLLAKLQPGGRSPRLGWTARQARGYSLQESR